VKKSALPEPTDVVAVVDQSGEQVEYKCGHTFASKFAYDFYGEKGTTDDKYLVSREECGDCILASVVPHVIRCALCGRAILPGGGVAIYDYDNTIARSYAVKIDKDNHSIMLGCLRWDCCPAGLFFGGHWDGEKFVPKFVGGGSFGEEFLQTSYLTTVICSTK